jgi:PST family polysaccharide transporter
MLFFRSSMADMAEIIAYFVAAVSFAVAGFGVWSLVFANLIGNIALSTLRWILCHWHPSLTFNIPHLKDLWGFGINVTGTRLVNTLGTRTLDYLILGRFLAPATLGFYSMAYRSATIASNIVWFVMNRVAVPAFSLLQDEDDRLRRAFLKSTTFISLGGLPLFTGLALLAPQFVEVVFGEKWLAIVLPMRILCIASAASVLSTVAVYIFLAKGLPNRNLKIASAQVALLLPAALIGVRFGAAGVAAAVSVVNVMIWFAYQIFVTRLLNMSIRDYLLALRPAAFGSLLMSIVLLAFHNGVTVPLGIPAVWSLVGSLVLGATTYFVTLKVVRTEAVNELVTLVREIFESSARPILSKLGLSRREAVRSIGSVSKEIK